MILLIASSALKIRSVLICCDLSAIYFDLALLFGQNMWYNICKRYKKYEVISMLGWIIIAILCVIAVLYVTRCSPILFGIIMAIPVLYIGVYALIPTLAIISGILIFYVLNAILDMPCRYNENLKLLLSLTNRKSLINIGGIFLLVHYIGWPFELGYLLSIAIINETFPEMLTHDIMVNVLESATGIGIILFFVSFIVHLFVWYSWIKNNWFKNHRST